MVAMVASISSNATPMPKMPLASPAAVPGQRGRFRHYIGVVAKYPKVRKTHPQRPLSAITVPSGDNGWPMPGVYSEVPSPYPGSGRPAYRGLLAVDADAQTGNRDRAG
jgi:hypothetical protein